MHRYLAAVEVDIERLNSARNVLQKEIERLEKERVVIGQLWNHSRRATRFAKRTSRQVWWLLRLSPLLHVGFAVLALVIAVVADRQTALIERLTYVTYSLTAHDIAVALVFGIQFYFYEPVASYLAKVLFRRAYARLVVAGRIAATSVAALATHVQAIDAGVSEIAARVHAASQKSHK